jgi:hypothetical protein
MVFNIHDLISLQKLFYTIINPPVEPFTCILCFVYAIAFIWVFFLI